MTRQVHLHGSERDPPSEPPDLRPPPAPRETFRRPSVELARELLGRLLVREDDAGVSAGVIVETEAYAGPADRASHARAGRTARTAPMFGPAGHAYVYLVYGIHHCVNVVAEDDGVAGAVLLRALEPLTGEVAMRIRRGGFGGQAARLASGPGSLCRALGIDRRLDGHDLTLGSTLWIALPPAPIAARVASAGVVTGPRVGVGYAGPGWADRPWRFGVRGHPSLSRSFPATPDAAPGAQTPEP